MFTSKKTEGIKRFVCDVSLYVAETPKASIKYHKLPLPIIPFGIVAYGFVGQPFLKQLYTGGLAPEGLMWTYFTQKLKFKNTKDISFVRPSAVRSSLPQAWANIPQTSSHALLG